MLEGQILNSIGRWVYALFLVSGDVTMILRVWAMYSRSRPILAVLLTFLSIEIVTMTAFSAVYSEPNNASELEVAIQIPGQSVCVKESALPILMETADVAQLTFALVLCLLAVLQFVRQSLEMYQVAKRWQLNRYINLLVEQGILYFLVVFLLNLICLLYYTGHIPGTGPQFIFATIVEYVPMYTLTPRFIISIRELYAHDVQGRSEGIDTGFGLSRSNQGGDPVGLIVFAAPLQGESFESMESEENGHWQNKGAENAADVGPA